MRRLLSAVLIAVVLPWVVPSAGLATPCADVMVESFAIDTKWSTKELSPGSKVNVAVTVTREDPQELGIRQPVEGATVASGLFFPSDLAFGEGKTNGEGKVSLTVRIPRSKPGKISGHTFAYIWHREGEAVCASIVEYGHRRDRGFVLKR